MTFDIAAFRSAFPEFTDPTVYPDAMINFWAAVAFELLPLCIWKNLFTQATQLYVAHAITIAAQNVKESGNGGAPGTFGGVASNKAVGGASVAYDATDTSYQNAGWYNLTNYGKMLYAWIKMFGAGCVQL